MTIKFGYYPLTHHRQIMRTISALFLSLFLVGLLFLSACGQKGALFIPDEIIPDEQSVKQTGDQDAEDN